MSFCHSAQIKWSSFLLLLLTIFLELPSTASWGICEERCDNNRLPGETDAYVLDCDKEYDKPSDIEYCRRDCKHCSDICKPSNPSIYRCPPNVRYHERCKEHCDSIRPSKFNGQAFNLDCSKYYSSNYEIEKCRSFCKDCPREICKGSTPDKYACPSQYGPSPPISGHCLNRCNNNRPKGSTKAYTLSCFPEYATIKELNFCRGDSWFCPRSVSNPYNPNIFHCPAVQLPTTTTTTTTPAPVIRGSCKKRCDDNRKSGTTAAYTLDCRRAYEFEDEIKDCTDDCFNCNRIFCNPFTNKNIFNCPKIPKPLPPPPPPTYEGKCQRRCDESRADGPYGLSNSAYILNCDEKYNGWVWETERKRCQRDCQFCPKNVCNPDTSRNLHYCPRFQLKKRCDDICNANRKYGSSEEYTLKCSTGYSSELEINYCRNYCEDCSIEICDPTSDNDTYHCPVNKNYGGSNRFPDPDPYPHPDPWGSRNGGQGSTSAIAAIIFFLLIVVACIGLCIYCCVRKKHSPQTQTGQYYGAPGAGAYATPTMAGQYAQQPAAYPMNFNYAASQSSASSISGPAPYYNAKSW